ncbi:kelch-like protein diablo isoform X3 [Gadus chalcogrammus]|uniref:kelch-like protein diablo isoform X3 n=1 Tax=Gadus chalcogrammus TaxID=1042646 RepID=UPI0024C2DBA4|nr:kelch-like protein diablo isoform X3 [Gadus chalcogrammus]
MAAIVPLNANAASSTVADVTFEEENDIHQANAECEDFMFVEATHPDKVLQGLNGIRLNNAFCDVTLCCGGQEFPCHRIVLAAISTYFQAMFSVDLIESRQERVALNGLEPQMIGMLVSYAYTSKVFISKANVQGLLAAANLLDIMPVREACCRFMERQMDETNCVGIHCFAEAHSCKTLEKRSMEYILANFKTVYQQEEFLSLCLDKLTQIIASDQLNVPQEEMVFEAAMLWLNKCSSRKQSFDKVLEHIRLPLISPYYLHDVIESLDVVREDQGCQRLISEAKDYLLLQDRRGELQCPRTRPRSSTGMVEVIITVGGEDDKVVLRSVETYDPILNQWKNLALLPFAISKHGLVVSGGAVLEDGDGTDLTQVYNPKTAMWTEVAPMQIARSGSAACTLNGKIYVIGGWHASTENTDKVECYNPETNKWTKCAPMKERRYRPGVAVVEAHIYVLGGEEGWDRYHDTIERYCSKTDTWEIVGEMPSSRSWLSCVTLPLRRDLPSEDSMELTDT